MPDPRKKDPVPRNQGPERNEQGDQRVEADRAKRPKVTPLDEDKKIKDGIEVNET